MARSDLLSELATRRLCCDGAMGTQLLARGLRGDECGMLWNVDRPADVREIHNAYGSAGSDLITTNSFGGSSFMLNRHHLAVTYAFQKTAQDVFCTIMGTSVEEAMQRATDSGAQIVGANCGTFLDLKDYVELAKQIVAVAGGAHVIIQPNAGSPRTEGDRTVYDATPEQMAATTLQLLAAGVQIVGGCCGTTSEHLSAISRALKGVNPGA